MFALIKHAAIYTQHPDATITFYKKLLGMKQIATAMTETNRRRISATGSSGLLFLRGVQVFPEDWIISALKSTIWNRPAKNQRKISEDDHHQRPGKSSLCGFSQPRPCRRAI